MSRFEVLPVQPDVRVLNHGSLWQFFLLSGEARAWAEDHIEAEGYMWSGSGHFRNFCAEHRYGPDIAEGMMADGLEVVGG